MRARHLSVLAGCALVAASCASPSDDPRPDAKSVSQAVDWSAGAVSPIRIRQGHTSTLLGTGEVLVAGGGAAPKTSEIIDPYRSTVVEGPDLVEPRTFHTATMLLSGRVLLVGGARNPGGAGIGSEPTATAELYDPLMRTTVATAPMAVARKKHVAIRLRSGKVLVGGGDSEDQRTEIYDPSLGAWSPGPNRGGYSMLAAMATLTDGRVAAVANDPGSGEASVELLDLDASAWRSVSPSLFPAPVTTLTRLGNGSFAVSQVTGCAFISLAPICTTTTSVLSSDGSNGVFGPDFNRGRDSFTAARTVDGHALFVGGWIGTAAAELLVDPAAAKLTSDVGTLTAEHIGPTATVLPGGDVLVVGGEQARLERRPHGGVWSGFGVRMRSGREKHAATRLHDGSVLVAGGEDNDVEDVSARGPVLQAERIDRLANTITDAGTLRTAHLFGTLTTLRDGRALLVGGETAAVEIYTPGVGFADGPPLSVARSDHTATLLPSGKVLVVGGAATRAPAEIFDPTTNTWSLGPTPENDFTRCTYEFVQACTNHGAVLMPNGLVLLVGESGAELFDERAGRFRRTSPTGGARDGATARLLPNGKVFVSGGATLAAELFDPSTETWAYTSTLGYRTIRERYTSVPSGKAVASGGHSPGNAGISSTSRQFDPLAHPTGSFFTTVTGAQHAFMDSATLAGTGEVIQAGGQACWGPCVISTLDSVTVHGDGATPGLRPAIVDAPATVTAGTRVTIAGSGFAHAAEASAGNTGSSAVNHPTAVWVSDAGDAVVPSTIVDFTETTATWLVPTTALYGHGQLFVNVGGVFSYGRSVTIMPALAATTCANDAQCATGFCTDGVCCDRRCDGVCEGCSAARKTSGEDGVCGAVPPGKDITGRCVLKLGEACSGGNECGTGFCAQGVCCDSTCDGQCLSCNLQGQAGRCSAINEGACSATCDGDHRLVSLGETVTDCAPYRCSGAECNKSCASARDCVAPAVCTADGKCVPPVAPPRSSDSVCGCRAAGAPGPSGSLAVSGTMGLGLLFLARIARIARRRRR